MTDITYRDHLRLTLVPESPPLLLTTVGEADDSASSFAEACLAAARHLADGLGGEKPVLLLEYSHESAVMLRAFQRAGVNFDLYVMDFRNLPDSPVSAWAAALLAGSGLEARPIEFDFENETHLLELDRLQQSTGCTDMENLFRMWASCSIDGFPVLAGRFVLPQLDHALQIAGWNLPGFEELATVDFFRHFGGVPFFMNYTAELVHAQAESGLAREVLELARRENLAPPPARELRRLFYNTSGFRAPEEADLRFQMEPFHRQAVKTCSRDIQEKLICIYRRIIEAQKARPRARQEIRPGGVGAAGPKFSGGANTAPESAPESGLRRLSRPNHIRGALVEISEARAGESRCYATFPTLISTHRYTGDLAAALTAVSGLEYFGNLGNSISRTDLHVRPELAGVVEFFREAVRFHLAKLAYIYDDFEFTQCWANRSGPHQHHHHHAHPNCELGGLLYLTTGGGGNTVFSNSPYKQIQPHRHSQSIWSGTNAEFTPEAGKLVVFPAHLEHSTRVHQAADPRYTLSFNVMLRGEIGSLFEASWLKL